MLTRYIRHFVLLLALTALTFNTAAAGGYTAFDFLRIPMNARAAALGNTFLTIRDDPALLFSNPGGLSTLKLPSASIGFVKHLLDVNAGYAVYGQNFENIGWIGGGVVYMNYGSFDRTDKFANTTGTFGASDLAITAGYGNYYENLHYGGSLKVIYSYIDEFNATGIAIDAGAQYVIPEEEIVIGLAILNAGIQTSPFGKKKEDLPLDITVGVSKKLQHLPLNAMLCFHKLNESQDNLLDHLSAFSIGGEFMLSSAFRARFGYNNEMRKELKIGSSAGLAGLAAGFGLQISTYNLDYAFTSFGKIGSLHRVSVSAAF